MKKIILFGVIFLVLWGSVLFGQETQKPYSYNFDKGVGECVFTGVSFDQVWTTMVKVLMLNKYRIVSAEKQSNVIIAEVRPFASWNYDLSLYFERRGENVCVMASVLPTKRMQGDLLANLIGIGEAEHKEEKKLFDKVVKLLYGEEV